MKVQIDIEQYNFLETYDLLESAAYSINVSKIYNGKIGEFEHFANVKDNTEAYRPITSHQCGFEFGAWLEFIMFRNEKK